MERKLPIIEIEGTQFIVDIINEELREKDRPENILDIKKMSYMGLNKGYSFYYDVEIRNYPKDLPFSDDDFKKIDIQDFSKIDPYGMALKYNTSVEKVKNLN